MEIFEFGFMIRAFMAGAAVAVIAPLIGIFMVVRRYSLMADTLAHVSLVGVAIGLLTKTYPALWAMAVCTATAVGIEKLRSGGKMYGESAVAIFFWAGIALAVVLISMAKGFNVDLFSFLFGSITTVTDTDLYFIGGLTVVVISVVAVLYRQFFSISFDEEYADSSGISSKTYNMILVVLAAVTISMSIRIVGMLLIGALMVVPVMTAMQLARSFKQTIVMSIGISIVSVMAGLLTSYYFDLASGGTIVLSAIGFFLTATFLKKLTSKYRKMTSAKGGAAGGQ
ncbi:MAG: metal ABC transporter permease [Nitrospirae bacterium]|nr:metal ABC transporter permease [Nitrospirota bacterium]